MGVPQIREVVGHSHSCEICPALLRCGSDVKKFRGKTTASSAAIKEKLAMLYPDKQQSMYNSKRQQDANEFLLGNMIYQKSAFTLPFTYLKLA